MNDEEKSRDDTQSRDMLQVIDFDGPVDLYHFYLLRAVGKGAFGKVRVVQHKQTKVSEHLGEREDVLPDTPSSESIRTQIHQQGEMHQDESSIQYYTREAAT